MSDITHVVCIYGDTNLRGDLEHYLNYENGLNLAPIETYSLDQFEVQIKKKPEVREYVAGFESLKLVNETYGKGRFCSPECPHRSGDSCMLVPNVFPGQEGQLLVRINENYYRTSNCKYIFGGQNYLLGDKK